MSRTTAFDVRHATRECLDDVDLLFGRSGASNGCWCQYWLLGPDYHRRSRADNRRDLARQICENRAGLLAYRGERPVGWARFTRRSSLIWLEHRFPRYDFGPDDPYALSCFFVARKERGEGVMSALVGFAAGWAEDRGETVEAYPIDVRAEGATGNRFPGVLSLFLRAGFVETGRLAADRAVVRRSP